jgi:hypothetical protein
VLTLALTELRELSTLEEEFENEFDEALYVVMLLLRFDIAEPNSAWSLGL